LRKVARRPPGFIDLAQAFVTAPNPSILNDMAAICFGPHRFSSLRKSASERVLITSSAVSHARRAWSMP
jgi:hypothetical protein